VRPAFGISLRSGTARRAAVFACLALFLALQVFSASAPLHKALHPDADSPDHRCAITLFAHGQVDAPAVWSGFLALAPLLVILVASLTGASLSSFDLRLAPGRAPPRR